MKQESNPRRKGRQAHASGTQHGQTGGFQWRSAELVKKLLDKLVSRLGPKLMKCCGPGREAHDGSREAC